MADKEDKAADGEDVEAIKNKMMADLEEDEDGQPDKLTKENIRLKNTIKNLQGSVANLQEQLQQQEEDTQMKKGNFTGVLQQKDKQLDDMKADLALARLETQRLIIGRAHGIPDKWCLAIPGTDEDEITANAVAMSADLPKPVGYSDGGEDVKTFTRQGNVQSTKHHKIVDNAF